LSNDSQRRLLKVAANAQGFVPPLNTEVKLKI